MSEVSMNVTLLAHTKLNDEFLIDHVQRKIYMDTPLDYEPRFYQATDGQQIALTAIRSCYSHLPPSDILPTEGAKYFNHSATDCKGGTEADRLSRHVVNSGHTSTLEHLSFTFAIEGISRSLLAQLTRHRVGFSFSVQSQRYVRMGSNDKSGGFDYVVPESVKNDDSAGYSYDNFMAEAQRVYDHLRSRGVPPEDARAVLPNAAATNLTMTANLRALLDFYGKRRKGSGAQAEITQLAEALRRCVFDVEPWTDQFFEEA